MGGQEIPLLDWQKGAACLHYHPQPRGRAPKLPGFHTHSAKVPRGRRQRDLGALRRGRGGGGGEEPACFQPWVTPPLPLWLFKEGNPAGWVSFLTGSLSCSIAFISLIQPSKA